MSEQSIDTRPVEAAAPPLSRRRFLATAGTGLVAATAMTDLSLPLLAQDVPARLAATPLPPIPLPAISAPTEREMTQAPTAVPRDQRLGFAIVGLGRLALNQILPAFGQAKRCRPVALVSGDAAKAGQVAQQYGIKPQNVYNYQNYDSLRDNPDVDVIYIVLPNSMHAEYTVRGAKAGKHILCEKPMATSVQEAQQMINACKQANKKLMIAYRIQYEPYNRAMQQMLRSKELGSVTMMTLDNGQNQGGDLSQWRLKKALSGGGSLPDVGIYCFNTARFLTGEEPTEVSASIYTTPNDPRFKEVEELVQWTMRFPSGIQANCSCSYGYHETRAYRVFGSEASALMYPAFSYRGLQMIVTHKSKTNPMMENFETRRLDEKDQFALEMDHMAECVSENKQPYTPGEEGLQDHHVMAAIYEAAYAGHPVKLAAMNGLDITRGSAPTPLP